MSAPNVSTGLHQDCLAKLHRALDLVLQAAEDADTANNPKLVIQDAREASRIAALIHKMTAAPATGAAAARRTCCSRTWIPSSRPGRWRPGAASLKPCLPISPKIIMRSGPSARAWPPP
jgi:hypothetical protein